MTLLSEHLGREVLTTARRENRVALPLPPFAYDKPARAILHTRYAEDFEHYGYGSRRHADRC